MNNSDQAIEVFSESSHSDWITAYNWACFFGFTLAVLGILGNFLCFFTAGFLPASTSAYLMKYLAVWDTLAAMQDGIMNLGFRFFDINVANIHTLVCKVFHYHSWGSSITANYLILAMAIDRVLAIKAPFWHRSHSSKHLARKISSLCVLFSYFLVLPNLYFFGNEEENGKELCVTRPRAYASFFKLYNFTANYIVFFGIPFSFLFCANVFFIYALRKQGIWAKRKKKILALDISETVERSVPIAQESKNVLTGSKLDAKGDNDVNKNGAADKLLTIPEKSCFRKSSEDSKTSEAVSVKIDEKSIGMKCQIETEMKPKSKRFHSQKRSAQCDRNYIIMLLSVTCSFLVLALAVAAINYLAISASQNPDEDPNKVNFLLAMAEIPTIMNNCLNFLFYLSSSNMFRMAFKTAYGPLFLCGKKEKAKDGHSISLSQREQNSRELSAAKKKASSAGAADEAAISGVLKLTETAI